MFGDEDVTGFKGSVVVDDFHQGLAGTTVHRRTVLGRPKIDPEMVNHGESQFLRKNSLFRNSSVAVLEPAVADEGLPTFDLHAVEESLLINHRVFNGNQLTREEMQDAVAGYRRFLRHHKMAGMPTQFQVPSMMIDRVWHTHMCETEQYQRDCMEYFDRPFHHASLICGGGGER